jgi:hypothetical protein
MILSDDQELACADCGEYMLHQYKVKAKKVHEKISIFFKCETCNSITELTITQHKGWTTLEVGINEAETKMHVAERTIDNTIHEIEMKKWRK